MQALQFWKTVVGDGADMLEELTSLLDEHGVDYCVIGGQAVNAYAEPLVSLGLDIVIAVADLPRVEPLLHQRFRMTSFPHSINLSAVGSALRVQIHTDPRYAAFVARASRMQVLGIMLPVAALEDVLQGKVWAALDDQRRPSKRQKDLADIARILETRPDLRDQVPEELRRRLL